MRLNNSAPAVLLALVLLAPMAAAQSAAPEPPDQVLLRAVARSAEALLALEETEGSGEWSYEGAMRIQGQIPIGYRVGGTGTVLSAFARLPGVARAPELRAAAERATDFLVDILDEREMSEDIVPGYDMRLWGFINGLGGLLDVRDAGLVPAERKEAVDKAIRTYLRRLVAQEIPHSGGWSYHRPTGRHLPAPPYSYVTADVLVLLYEARRQGFELDAAVVERALDLLERQRQPAGPFLYKGEKAIGPAPTIPGSVGRMAGCETALFLAGRSSQLHLRGALDSFLAHWHLLEELRGRRGLHTPPHMLAPYYFMYAHLHAARAVELLPEVHRGEYRARLRELLFELRDEKGLWNDRVFLRAAGYGTAAGLLALLQPMLPPLATWAPDAPADDAGE